MGNTVIVYLSKDSRGKYISLIRIDRTKAEMKKLSVAKVKNLNPHQKDILKTGYPYIYERNL